MVYPTFRTSASNFFNFYGTGEKCIIMGDKKVVLAPHGFKKYIREVKKVDKTVINNELHVTHAS